MVRVLHLTDTHLFAEPAGKMFHVNTRDSLRAVIEHALRNVPEFDLVLVTRDLVHDESRDGYEALHNLMLTVNRPAYFIPGNHDDPHMMRQVLPNFDASGFHAIEQGEWSIILLDTSVAGRVEGEVTPACLKRLESYLQYHAGNPVLIAVHHHIIDIESPWLDTLNLHNNDDLVKILDRYNQVKLVINGHIHQELDRQQNSIRYLGTPATCFQFAPRQAKATIDDKPPGYRYLELSDDGGVETQVYYLAGYPRTM